MIPFFKKKIIFPFFIKINVNYIKFLFLVDKHDTEAESQDFKYDR